MPDYGVTADLARSAGCELELELHPTEYDIIDCPEFELPPTFLERLEIGQAVEELLWSPDRED